MIGGASNSRIPQADLDAGLSFCTCKEMQPYLKLFLVSTVLQLNQLSLPE
jgi:hypothetical protein